MNRKKSSDTPKSVKRVRRVKTATNEQISIKALKISPETHAFVFDNDDTLVTNGILDKGWLVLKNLLIILATGIAHPIIMYQLIRNYLVDEDAAPAEQWQEIFKQLARNKNAGEYRFACFIQEWAAMKRIIPGMDLLVKELFDHGYSLSLWTDMGKHDGKALAHKFEHLYDRFSFCSYNSYKDEKACVKKPSEQAVENFVALSKKHLGDGKTIILIDDKLKNCLAAKKFGKFDYIHFQSAQQVRYALEKKSAFDTTIGQTYRERH